MVRLIKSSLAVFAILACLIGAFPLSQAQAATSYTPSEYWNGDANYPVAFSQAGVNRYLDLSSAVIKEQTTDTDGTTSTVVTFDVIMVNGDIQTKFSYESLIKINGDEISIAGRKGTGNWGLLSDKSFNQPQYNASLILIDHFKLK